MYHHHGSFNDTREHVPANIKNEPQRMFNTLDFRKRLHASVEHLFPRIFFFVQVVVRSIWLYFVVVV